MMDCKQVHALIPELLGGDLSPEEQREVEQHVASCEQCAQEVGSLQHLWEDLGAIPEEEPSPAVSARFYAMLERHRETEKKSSRKRGLDVAGILAWWRRMRISPVAKGAVAVTAALCIGFFSGRYIGYSAAGARDVTTLRQQVDSMQQTVSLLLLQQSSPSQRLLGVSKTARVSRPDRQLLGSLLETVNTDPNVNVRMAAVDALYLYRDQPGVRNALLQSLDSQQSPMVQIALIDLLVAMREQRALESLRALLKEQNINNTVRERAEWGIKQLS